DIYHKLVITSQIGFKQVAAHYAITSLFNHVRNTVTGQDADKQYHGNYQRVYCYTAHELDYYKQRIGPLTMVVGHLQLVSDITWESENLIFAVLHLGGWDFHCCIQQF
ncbi:MAG: DUF3536 domain-containing protein, partial [Dolichospermum sp.]